MRSYAPQVQTIGDPNFYGNALRFETEAEAKSWAEERRQLWTLVETTRVVESEDPPNYRFNNGSLEPIETEVQPYQFFDFTLRADMVAALKRYAQHHEPVGDFLRLALSNDLMGCVGRADDDNQHNIPALCAYLYNEMPAGSHGSPERYEAWLKARQEAA